MTTPKVAPTTIPHPLPTADGNRRLMLAILGVTHP